VELDATAYEFLIDHGFSPELGARPLQRAIERYLLAPLAATIVGQGVPEGERFVLVRAGQDRLTITFVDPDAAPTEDDAKTPDPVPVKAKPASLELDARALALTPSINRQTNEFLLAESARIAETARLLELEESKEAALREMNESGFWERSDRFQLLARVEYLDRFDAALRTAQRQAERLLLQSAHVESIDERERVRWLATRLYVLDCALAGLESGAAMDVFVRLRRWSSDLGPDEPGERNILDTLSSMYRQWAEAREMQLRELAAEPDERFIAVAGLGCGQILEADAGLHVFDSGRQSGPRAPAHLHPVAEVCVAPWIAGQDDRSRSLLEHARTACEAARCPAEVVRRYRTGPSPLVRDRVRGYRTGRLTDVLSGGFDLF
jgi:ATP-dependent Clp protease ATP-binding subunit ClpC